MTTNSSPLIDTAQVINHNFNSSFNFVVVLLQVSVKNKLFYNARKEGLGKPQKVTLKSVAVY